MKWLQNVGFLKHRERNLPERGSRREELRSPSLLFLTRRTKTTPWLKAETLAVCRGLSRSC